MEVMKNRIATLTILFLLILTSCDNSEVERSKFRFSDNEAKSIQDSLIEFKKLSVKLSNNGNYSKKNMLNFELGHDSVIILYNDQKRLFKITKEEFRSTKDRVYDLEVFKGLKREETKRLFSLLEYLNKFYINGVTYYYRDSLASFRYLDAPFINNKYRYFYKNIILENDFYSLEENKRNNWLNVNLIIDKKANLLLLVGDKERYLGGYDRIPEKWKQPTDEVFHKE